MAESISSPDDMTRARLAAVAAELRSILEAGGALAPSGVREVMTAATLLYSAAVSRAGRELSLADRTVSATDTVVLACALLRSQNLSPFELTLWFGRTNLDDAPHDL